MKTKIEFCKWLLIADYAVFLLLVCLLLWCEAGSNLVMVVSGWVAQLGVSTGFYFWKAKAENLVKLPIYLLKDIPEKYMITTDPNRVIESVLTNTKG